MIQNDVEIKTYYSNINNDYLNNICQNNNIKKIKKI